MIVGTCKAASDNGSSGDCGIHCQWFSKQLYHQPSYKSPDAVANSSPKATSNNEPQRTPSQCAGQSLKKNAVALSLDAAGIGAGFLPGGDLVVAGAQATVSVASGVNSAMNGDGFGTASGILGLPASVAGGAAKTLGVGAKAIPGVGSMISAIGLGNDAFSAVEDYKACEVGQ